jgi:hypothetical protein
MPQEEDKKLTLAELDALDDNQGDTGTEGSSEESETVESTETNEVKDSENETNDTDSSSEDEQSEETAEAQEESESEEVEEGSIWEDVEALTGEKLEVDFGSIDPDTPEGVSRYIQAVKNAHEQSILERLSKEAPLAYRALELERDGKNVKEYFVGSDNDTTDYTNLSIAEEDVKIQKQVIRKALEERGLDEEDVDAMIDVYEDKGILYNKAKTSQTELVKAEEQRRSDYESSIQEQREAEDRLVESMSTTIGSVVGDGKVGNFVIPEKDKAKFAQFVQDSMAFDGKKFYIYKEVDTDKLDQVIQEQFFSFKGGNLDSLIEARAKTEGAKRIKRASKGKLKSSESRPNKKTYLKDL